MDEELNARLRSVLRDLREVLHKLECQLAVAAADATPTHCSKCAHSWGMHSFSGCIAAPSGHPEKCCPCTVANP